MFNFQYAFLLVCIYACASLKLVAQEEDTDYNLLSLNPISKGRIMYKTTVWRRLDMREKKNWPFFSRNKEISTIIIDGVKSDLITPYATDLVTTPMSKADFLENLKYPEESGGLTEEERALGFDNTDSDVDWGDQGNVSEVATPESNEYPSRDFSIVEVKEDYFFDKVRSRMYHDILVIGILLPADKNPAGFEKALAYFRFIDLATFFRSIPEDAIWFNAKNHAGHLNMTDAFLLRLFSSSITKIANPNDDRLVDIYSKDKKRAALASQEAEYHLIDFESQLWEH